MGQCYNVTLRICVYDEQKLIDAMEEIIKSDESKINPTHYRRKEKAELVGINPDCLDAYILAVFGKDEICKEYIKGFAVYYFDYDASYSWELIMMDMFGRIAPYLTDRSSLTIYPDSGRDRLVVKNGIAI